MRSTWLALTLLVASTTPAIARADLDPESAAHDVRALRDEGLDGFCRTPTTPLPPRAIGLCGHAREVEGCEGFAAACASLERKAPDLSWLAWLAKVFVRIGPAIQALLWALVAAVLFLLLRPLVSWWLRARRQGPSPDDRSGDKPATVATRATQEVEGDQDAEALLARAAELEAKGDRARALSTYLAAALQALQARGALRRTRATTNGEYVRACADDAARAPLRALVREVDLAEYGGRPPVRDAVARAGSAATALVRGLPLALLVFALSGCGEALRHASPDHDPSGDQLLVALLRRQGVKVDRSGPLASLPLPREGDEAPTVFVDLTRTPLDAEAGAHLVAFVRRGGGLVLVGEPAAWPEPFDARREPTLSDKVFVTPGDGRDERWSAQLIEQAAFTWERGTAIATTGDGRTFAAVRTLGRGQVVAVAGPELFSNVALAREGNAAAALAILDVVARPTVWFARASDGTSAPTDPLGALIAAGLGLALAHAAGATALLFLARGTRLARPTPRPAPRRRAFVEHVEATGALWARTRLWPHALKVYGRYVEERWRARGGPPDERARSLLARARQSRSDETPRGDELRTMIQLGTLAEDRR